MKVMKFGGTSVADQPAIERLIALVRAERQAEAQTEGGDARGPVVVVSALSGVTDRLLGVAALAGSGDVEGARTSLQDLRARHVKVSEVIKDAPLRQTIVDALNRDFVGRVDAITPASAATFSLLPSSNASGNFTKVTQYVPIKVAVDAAGVVLPLGTSVEVRIHVREPRSAFPLPWQP